MHEYKETGWLSLPMCSSFVSCYYSLCRLKEKLMKLL